MRPDRKNDKRDHVGWNSKNGAGAHEVPDRGTAADVRKRVGESPRRLIVGGADDNEDDERGQKRPRFAISNQAAIQSAYQGAKQYDEKDHHRQRQTEDEIEIQ